MGCNSYAPMSKLGDWLSHAAVGFFVGLFGSLIAGLWVGAHIGCNDAQVKAVKAGVAEWLAQPDGSTIFKFKELPK